MNDVYDTFVELRQKLIDHEMSVRQIREITAMYANKKSWSSKSWKAARKEIIKNQCEQCGKDEGIMVIQHFIHPQRFNDIHTTHIERVGGWGCKTANWDKVEEEALLEWLDQYIVYFSLKGTKTFCKSCAYKWDMLARAYCKRCDIWYFRNMDCPECGFNILKEASHDHP